MELFGTEVQTLELDGVIAAGDARTHVDERLALERVDGGIRVRLLAFAMQGLRARGIPGPSFDYREALWMVGVVHEGSPCWYAVACDLDHPIILLSGAALVRYPVRRAAVSMIHDERSLAFGVRARDGASFVAKATLRDGGPPPTPARRMLVRSFGSLYEIPWREEAAPLRAWADCDVSVAALGVRTLGASLSWDPRGLVHRGRTHICGIARAIRRARVPAAVTV